MKTLSTQNDEVMSKAKSLQSAIPFVTTTSYLQVDIWSKFYWYDIAHLLTPNYYMKIILIENKIWYNALFTIPIEENHIISSLWKD